VFLFFSSRLGCLGSLTVSVILTLILLAVFHVLRAGTSPGHSHAEQAHADQPRARRKYCRSGADPFGEPGSRPLVPPAGATHRNQWNLT